MHGPNRVSDFNEHICLCHDTHCPLSNCLPENAFLAAQCDNKDLDLIPESADSSGRFNPVEAWHVDVHENDIWLQASGQLDRFMPIARIANALYVRVAPEQCPDALSYQGLIVDYQYTNHGVVRQCSLRQKKRESQHRIAQPASAAFLLQSRAAGLPFSIVRR